MKILKLLFFLFLSTCVFPQEKKPEILLNHIEDYVSQFGNLEMFTYVPKQLIKNKKAPMIVVLHGCTQTAVDAAELTGWNELADKLGLYILYPQQKMTNNPYRCYNWYRNADIEKGKGELQAIKDMMDYMYTHYAIDTSKTFVTGLSAGAAMGTALMAVFPNLFNSGAIMAGGPYKSSVNVLTATSGMKGWVNRSAKEWADLVYEQNPGYKGTYPKMIIYQGTTDPVVNYRNAGEMIEQWTYIHKIDTIPDDTISGYLRKKGIKRIAYADSAGNEKVVFYELEKMTHALLVNPGICEQQGGHKTIFGVDRDYNSSYWTAVDWGLITEPLVSGPTTVASNSEISLSIPETIGAYYRWTLPPDCKLVTDEQTNKITIKWGTKPGVVKAFITDSKGCRFDYKDLSVKIK